jgi:hypothetical protein
VPVGDQVPVHDLGDLGFEGPQGVLAALAFVEFASVVGPSGGVVADLGHRGDVQRPVQLPVAVRVEPVAVLGAWLDAAMGALPV